VCVCICPSPQPSSWKVRQRKAPVLLSLVEVRSENKTIDPIMLPQEIFMVLPFTFKGDFGVQLDKRRQERSSGVRVINIDKGDGMISAICLRGIEAVDPLLNRIV
jgi:hypothetical protein